MDIAERMNLVYKEIRQEIEKKFNVKTSVARGIFEDNRDESKVGISFMPQISSITTYGGSARILNDVVLNTYITVDKNVKLNGKPTGQLTRQTLAMEIFAYFGSRWGYENFLILDCYDFDEDFVGVGVGETYKFKIKLNVKI